MLWIDNFTIKCLIFRHIIISILKLCVFWHWNTFADNFSSVCRIVLKQWLITCQVLQLLVLMLFWLHGQSGFLSEYHNLENFHTISGHHGPNISFLLKSEYTVSDYLGYRMQMRVLYPLLPEYQNGLLMPLRRSVLRHSFLLCS